MNRNKNIEYAINERFKLSANIEKAITCPSSVEKSIGILNMGLDCFRELLDWLSLADLKALRQTCKNLKVHIDLYIEMYYPTIRIGYKKVEHIRDFESSSKNLIKEIRFLNYEQKFRNEFEDHGEILSSVQSVRLFKNCVNGEFYETLLKFCSNLRSLTISRICDDTLVGFVNKWLLRQYPKLENFKLLDFLEPEGSGIQEMTTFFELNSSIRTFSTSLQFLKANGQYFKKTTTKLDQLCINITSEHYNLIGDVMNVLIELHRHGFYQCLYLYRGCLCTVDGVNLKGLLSMPGLEKIRFSSCEQLDLPPLPGLKELKIGSIKMSTDWKIVSNSIMNVERVYIENGSLSDIEPFIHHFEKLKHIKIGFGASQKNDTRFPLDRGLTIGQSKDSFYVDYLSSLDKERSKLANASKTTIYIDEEIYLALKWSSNIRNFKSIELKRSEAFQWNNHNWYELNDGEDKLKST